VCLSVIAEGDIGRGDVADAIPLLRRAGDLERRARGRTTLAATLQWLGYAELQADQLAASRRDFAAAIAVGDTVGYGSAVAWSWFGLANLSIELGDLSTASGSLGNADSLFKAQGDGIGIARGRALRALVDRLAGHDEEARAMYDTVLVDAARSGDFALEGDTRVALAQLALANGDVPEAHSELAAYRTLARRKGSVEAAAGRSYEFAVLALAEGNLERAEILFRGILAQLGGRLGVQMSDLHSSDYPKLEPATFDLVAELQNNQLAFNGKLQQTKIQPVQITANLPFDVSKIIAERKFDEEAPLTAKVQLPRGSVNFLRQFLPVIIQLDGDLALDASVNGTIAKPVLSGSGDITINMARFSNATLPAVSGFHSRLTFDRDVLNFERFNGDIAGGPFTISGRVTFPKLTEPNLDFQLKAQSILVARNDSLTARADADLRVMGPWASATVTGNVALTNSQFLKNIDLIPIGLPGRPAPQPRSERPDFSVPQPPIRDWKFDVAIKTKDSFLIRGNLANGGAIVDLHLSGTGLRPALQGLVRLENVEATLPFSRLEIAQGFLYFDPSDSFNPKIDLQGTSLIHDYTVHVYVYGTSLSPEAIFSSEPPLPQEEIISLLATGVTRGELIGNNNVLAGRAAMLLVQQLYQKVFKKGQATKSNSVFDRLQVDIGQVDPRTGQQTATARFKVNDKFVLVGDLGVGGDFRGMVKYLIRFK